MTTANRTALFQSRAFRTVKRVGTTLDLTPASVGNGASLFTVTGVVEVSQLFGVITVVIGAGLAVPRLQFLNSAAGLVALCAAAASIATLGVDTILTWTGLAAGLLTPSTVIGAGGGSAAEVFTGTLKLSNGSVRLTNAVSAVSGKIDWYCRYIPVSDGALVVPA